MKKFIFLFPAMLMLAAAGCTAPFEETVSPADITVEQLESRMKQAMDPNGRFANAQTYIMRQQITTERGWMEPPQIQMVEVKFRRPDKFRLTTFTDNEPESAIIASGNRGWLVDLKRRKTVALDSRMLPRVLAMVRLTNPGNNLKNVFDKVVLDRSRIDDEDFYRFTCSNGSNRPMHIYVGSNDFLNKRLRMKLDIGNTTLDYDSRMLCYSMYEGVMIPDESVVVQGGTEQRSKVIYYKLDANIEDSEFQPPLF